MEAVAEIEEKVEKEKVEADEEIKDIIDKEEKVEFDQQMKAMIEKDKIVEVEDD